MTRKELFAQGLRGILVVFAMLLLPSGAWAAAGDEFTVNKLKYKVNDDGKSVTVTGHEDRADATGTLTIPDKVTNEGTTYTVTTIGEYAFSHCIGFIGDLTIPNSVTTIGNSAFANTIFGSLTIGESVTTIGDGAFSHCIGFIGDLTIPNSVTTIGNSAFANTKFGSLTIGESVTTIGDGAFYECSGFKGDLTIPNSVTTIGEYAFYGCTGFNGHLTIGESVTTIGDEAFWGITNFIGDLIIPNSVTTIESNAFGVSGFNGSLTIGESITTIADMAFSYCGFKDKVIISKSVKTIGQRAFVNCWMKALIVMRYDATSDEPITKLGFESFDLCTSLKTIYVPSYALDAYKADDDWKKLSDKMKAIATVTVGTDVTATADNDPVITYDGKVFYAEDTKVTLGYTGEVPSGYVVVYTTKKTSDGTTDVTKDVISGSTLTMPDYDVTITASVVEKKYSLTTTAATGIKGITFTVGDKTVKEAAEGDEVTVTVTPVDGYTVTGLTATDNVTLEPVPGQAFAWKFTMPAEAVSVTATTQDLWGVSGDTPADGSKDKPFLISTTDGLDLLARRVNSGTDFSGKFFALANNIDYQNVANRYDPDGEGTYQSNYMAIGGVYNYFRYFKGSFDGKGFTVSGIRIHKQGSGAANSYQGLFGQLGEGAVVKSITLDASEIEGDIIIGGIVGNNNNGTITDCHVTDGVRIVGVGTENKNINIGGIVGNNFGDKAAVSGCTSKASVSRAGGKTGNQIGGVAGNNLNGEIKDCLYLGGEIQGDFMRGTIVGRNENSSIKNCYHTAAIKSTPAFYNIGSTATNTGLGHTITLEGGTTIGGTTTEYGCITAYGDAVLKHQPASGTAVYYSTEGATVTLGYKGSNGFSGFSVTKASGGTVDVKKDGDAYTFTMPADNVTVTLVEKTYAVTMATGTEDADSWTAKAGDGAAQALPLEGVKAGQTVTLTYGGGLKVKSVKATKDMLKTPLTFEAATSGTIDVQFPKEGMQYTKNGGKKTAVTGSIDVEKGDIVQFYGKGTSITSYRGTVISGGTADCYVYGNIMSLVDEDGFATNTELKSDFAFNCLFFNNEHLLSHADKQLKLPATTLTEYCYESLFKNCRKMTKAPELPAETLATYCYSNMFADCSNMTEAPSLPATTLAEGCYSGMFTICSSLSSAPELKAEKLVDDCYNDMFGGCTNLSSITCHAKENIDSGTTDSWVYGVSLTGTFTCYSKDDWPKGNNGIPDNWNVVEVTKP